MVNVITWWLTFTWWLLMRVRRELIMFLFILSLSRVTKVVVGWVTLLCPSFSFQLNFNPKGKCEMKIFSRVEYSYNSTWSYMSLLRPLTNLFIFSFLVSFISTLRIWDSNSLKYSLTLIGPWWRVWNFKRSSFLYEGGTNLVRIRVLMSIQEAAGDPWSYVLQTPSIGILQKS